MISTIIAASLALNIGYNAPFNLTSKNYNVNQAGKFHDGIASLVVETENPKFNVYGKLIYIHSFDDSEYDVRWDDKKHKWVHPAKDFRGVADRYMGAIGASYTAFDTVRFYGGLGYMANPDRVRLGGSTQFDLGFDVLFGDNFRIGFEHISNGHAIWGGHMPNVGINFINAGWKF